MEFFAKVRKSCSIPYRKIQTTKAWRSYINYDLRAHRSDRVFIPNYFVFAVGTTFDTIMKDKQSSKIHREYYQPEIPASGSNHVNYHLHA